MSSACATYDHRGLGRHLRRERTGHGKRPRNTHWHVHWRPDPKHGRMSVHEQREVRRHLLVNGKGVKGEVFIACVDFRRRVDARPSTTWRKDLSGRHTMPMGNPGVRITPGCIPGIAMFPSIPPGIGTGDAFENSRPCCCAETPAASTSTSTVTIACT